MLSLLKLHDSAVLGKVEYPAFLTDLISFNKDDIKEFG